ncbi:NADH-quinone oxidoreductase subunit H [Thermus oshimai]|jgi:formate hydrogenlyase subunit 4|uniref:respiratory chain complex I subunit 1 family protein n=1 Tax=Thermus sp. TaxID=275 RepID=UPI0030970B17
MSALLLLVLAPLFTGTLRWLKARLQNRIGPHPLYDYRNLAKLLRKAYILPQAASPMFLLGPVLALASTLLAALFLPLGPSLNFAGDFLLLLYLLNLGRFFQLAAALDAGSAFGGQGAYRESLVGVLAEPGTLLALAAVTWKGGFSLGHLEPWTAAHGLVYILALATLALALVAEGARMPVDDPTTHLELTMIHEAQLLDHGGPLLALYELAAGVKLLLYLGLMALLLPLPTGVAFALVFALGVLALAYLETYGVKLRYLRLPDLMSYGTLTGLLALLGEVLRLWV